MALEVREGGKCIMIAMHVMMGSIAVFLGSAVALPEPAEIACDRFNENPATKERCQELYLSAQSGNVNAMVDFGLGYLGGWGKGQDDLVLAEVLDYEIEKNIRAIPWFKIAYQMGSLRGAYWYAKSFHGVFQLGVLSGALPDGLDGRQVLERVLSVGSPAEAFVAASDCARSEAPGCYELLSEFFATGFGVRESRLLAAENLFKAGVRFLDMGNRDQAIVMYERLKKGYSDYPYVVELKDRLFPKIKNKEAPAPSGQRQRRGSRKLAPGSTDI